MLTGFWRLVERTMPDTVRRGPDVEARAQGRLLGAIALLMTLLAVISAPLDGLTNPDSVPVDLAIAVFGGALLLLQRRTGWIGLVGAVIVVALAFMGVGLGVVLPEPGDPNFGWIVVMGLAPMLSRSLLFTGLTTTVVMVLSFLFATSRPDVPTVVAFGEVFPLIIASWFTMYCVIYTHRRAYAEHVAAFDAQQRLEVLLDVESQQLAEEATSTLDFLKRVSHELRTPLNGVLGLTDLLAREEVSPAVTEQLARIQGAGRGVLRAFDTLLHVARAVAAGGTPLEECDLPGTLDACVHRVTHAIGAEPTRVALRVAPRVPRIVRVGQPILKTALDQLIGSLLEAEAEDVAVSVSLGGGRLRVVASGRLPNPDAPILALGLPLVAELVATSGGTFDRAAGSGEDVVVTLTLPCKATEPSGIQRSSEVPGSAGAAAGLHGAVVAGPPPAGARRPYEPGCSPP